MAITSAIGITANISGDCMRRLTVCELLDFSNLCDSATQGPGVRRLVVSLGAFAGTGNFHCPLSWIKRRSLTLPTLDPTSLSAVENAYAEIQLDSTGKTRALAFCGDST